MAKKTKRYEEGGDVQQYEGDDVSALMTAKQRMAERDAEYAAQQAAAPEAPRRPARKAKPAAKARPSAPTPEYAEEAPRRPSMMAPAVAALADKVRSGAAAMGRGDVSMGDMQGRGLRSLGGGTSVPAMKKGGKVKKMVRGGGVAARGVGRGKFV